MVSGRTDLILSTRSKESRKGFQISILEIFIENQNCLPLSSEFLLRILKSLVLKLAIRVVMAESMLTAITCLNFSLSASENSWLLMILICLINVDLPASPQPKRRHRCSLLRFALSFSMSKSDFYSFELCSFLKELYRFLPLSIFLAILASSLCFLSMAESLFEPPRHEQIAAIFNSANGDRPKKLTNFITNLCDNHFR